MTLKHRTQQEPTTSANQTQQDEKDQQNVEELELEDKKLKEFHSPKFFMNVETTHWKIAFYLFAFCALLRSFYIHHPPVTVHEEVKYGNHILSYQKGEFFLDSNPPLGSLILFGISRYISGELPAKMKFKEVGESFLLENAPYTGLRYICMIFGAMIPSALFICCLMMEISLPIALSIGLLAVFDSAFATSFRLMNVDSMFLAFNCASFLLLFRMMKEKSLSLKWFSYLIGCSLASALSVATKTGGKFNFAFVCAIFAIDWWKRCFKDRTKPIFPHLVADAAAKYSILSLTTWTIYFISFFIHLELLTSGPETPNSLPLISPRFKASFSNDTLAECPEILHYGARIVLKPYNDSNYYLHSHPNLYPKGSKQQQVTGYEHHDMNNIWIVRKPTSSDPEVKRRTIFKEIEGKQVEHHELYTEVLRPDEIQTLEVVKHGDIIRLEHEVTGRFLHSHHIEPPTSNKDHHCEVSAYGGLRYLAGDDNDDWKIEIVNDEGDVVGKKGEPVKCQSLFIRLLHTKVGCVLQSNKKNLADWGFFQREITCGKFSKKHVAVWTIIANEHPKYDETMAKAGIVPKTTLEKYKELMKCMKVNFKDLSKSTIVPSKPFGWISPKGASGMQMWNFNEALSIEGNIFDAKLKNSQIYLVPNLVNQTATLLAIFAFLVLGLVKWLFSMRNISILPQTDGFFSMESCAVAFGWLFHWLPWFFMENAVNYTDYFTSYVFSFVLFGHFMQNCLSKCWKNSSKLPIAIVVMSAMFYFAFSPLILGNSMSVGYCERLKGLNSKWTFICE